MTGGCFSFSLVDWSLEGSSDFAFEVGAQARRGADYAEIQCRLNQ